MIDQPLLELADRFLSLTLLIYAVYKMSAALTNRTDQFIKHLQERVAFLEAHLDNHEITTAQTARQRGDTRPLPRLERESDNIP